MTELEIASYLDRGLPASEKERLENHLVECSECRQNVTEAQQLIARVRRPPRALAALGLLAIAAVALFIVKPRDSLNESPVYRGGSPAANHQLVAHGPLGEAVARPVFVWGSARDVVSYRLNVSTADGTVVWTYSGRDTLVTLPATIEMRQSTPYVWVVDAITSDGSTLSTGLKQFHLTK